MKLSTDLIERLEFNDIRRLISLFAHCDISRKQLLTISPTNKIYVLEDELHKVNEFLDVVRYDGGLKINQFQDIRHHIKALQPDGASIQARYFHEFVKQQETGKHIEHFFGTHKEKYKYLTILASGFTYLPEVSRHINRCIDELGEIRDSASSGLQRIRREISSKESQVRTKIQELSKRFKEHLVDDLMTTRNGKHVLAVKAERVNSVSGVIHDYSGSGSTVYIEPNENVKISTALQKLYADEKKEIDKILIDLGNIVRPFSGELIRNFELLVQFDVLNAKALYGKKVRGCIPEVSTETQFVSLKKAYHPVLLENHSREEIVPLHIEFGDKERKVVLISGPNAGGKTITLKTVGLFSLMFQSGIPVPCDPKSVMPIYHKIFCDIGDNQSIENDLSTFSSHLVRIKEIVNESSVDSLILMDELGTGTDPKEGAGLAQAILEDLVGKQSNVIATTHLGELKLFADGYKSIQNASMEFDEEKLTSTFRLVQGIPGSSYAFFISKRMGLPENIINRGKEFTGDTQNNVENLLNNLNRQIYESEQLRNELDIKTARAASLEKMYESKLERLKKYEVQTREKALKEADQILADVNKKIEQTVAEIVKSNAEKERVKSARNEVAELKKNIKKRKSDIASKRGNVNDEVIEIGDKIKHLEFGTIAEVISKDKKFFTVQAGIMTMRLKKDEFELLEKKKKEVKQIKSRGGVSGSYTTDVSNEIDVRGLTFEEAWDKCDVFLDHASMTGWESVSIIHGKGTGVLREKINNQLRHDSRIKNKRLGNEGEGSTGVTVLTLR